MATDRAARKARMASAAGRRIEPEAKPAGRTAIQSQPVRVTLNLPPELFRDLDRWTTSAADQLERPRVPVQNALRAMIRAVTSGGPASDAVLTQLERER